MAIVFILSFIPVFIWIFMEPLALRFSDLNSITTSIGQILGLVGMVLFSINIILAGKLKLLDKYFKGLDKVYVNHGKIGSIAFSMLLFHPILLVIKYLLISTREAALFFVPFINMPITWGIISLLLMILLIAFTFYIKLKYHVWEISHKFMTLAFVFAVLHTLFISSDVSRNLFLRYYIFFFAFLAIFVMVRKFIFDYIINNKFKYKVVNLKELNKDIVEIEMTPLGKKMDFLSGQFAFFSFFSEAVGRESHPFSISSSEKDNNLKITVKSLGDYTKSFKNLKLNDGVLIDGPYGHFSYKNILNKNQIWIAGGIGITPFYSMASNLDKDYNIDFYCSVKEESEAVYTKELQEISSINPNFKYYLWDVKEKGYINADLISSLSGGLDGKDILICGPLAFMDSLKNQFTSLEVDINKIHNENFSF